MTVSIISPPRNHRKAAVSRLDPLVALLTVAWLFLAAQGRRVAAWEHAHDVALKHGIVLALSSATFGAVMALHLAGVR
jgi:Na+/glutamate symporter